MKQPVSRELLTWQPHNLKCYISRAETGRTHLLGITACGSRADFLVNHPGHGGVFAKSCRMQVRVYRNRPSVLTQPTALTAGLPDIFAMSSPGVYGITTAAWLVTLAMRF